MSVGFRECDGIPIVCTNLDPLSASSVVCEKSHGIPVAAEFLWKLRGQQTKVPPGGSTAKAMV